VDAIALVTEPPPAPPRPYPTLVKAGLSVDLALCVVMGLLALAATVQLANGAASAYPPAQAWTEAAIQYGIAGFGITGNLLLLRRQRSGFWFACVALVFVCAGIAMAFKALPVVVEGLEAERKVPLLFGFVATLVGRWLFNLGYAFVLRGAWRCLTATDTEAAHG